MRCFIIWSFLQALIPCIHRSLSLWCAHTSCPPVHFSLRLQSLIWTLESAYYYLGEVRRVGAHIYWGCPTLWACTRIISSNFCSLPCEECTVTSKTDTTGCELRKLTSNSRVWIILSSSKALARSLTCSTLENGSGPGCWCFCSLGWFHRFKNTWVSIFLLKLRAA